MCDKFLCLFGQDKGIGNCIRNTSIDEFPQFFSVIKGTGDIIGLTKKIELKTQPSAA